MNSFQDQPVFDGLVYIHDVNDILLLVEEAGDQLLDPMDLHLLTHEGKVVMKVVKVVAIGYGNLQEVALTPILSQLTDAMLFWIFHPSKPTSQKDLAHHPTIQVICIQVLKVTTLLFGVEPIAHILVACLHVSMNDLSDAALSTSLEHQQCIRVGYELQVSTSLLKSGMPSQSGRSVEVSQIKDVVF